MGRHVRACLTAIAALLALAVLIPPQRFAGNRSPIIIVPGLGGSQLEGRLANKVLPAGRRLCSRNSGGWFALWFNLEPLLTPGRFECWADNVRLDWDDNHQPQQPPGVEVRVPGWGQTHTVEHVDANAKNFVWLARKAREYDLAEVELTLSYLNPLHAFAQRLVDELGYTRGQDLRAAPYDFRLSPSSNPRWTVDAKRLIEDARAANGGRPVTIVCHSMGGLYTWHLLSTLEDSWIAENVLRLVLVSVPFAGTPKTLSMLLSGDDFDIPWVTPLSMRSVQRSFDASYVIAPSPHEWGNITLVRTPEHNFSADDMAALFEMAESQAGTDGEMLDHLRHVGDTTASLARSGVPRVPTLCVFGRGVPTPEELIYPNGDFDQPPEIRMGDGDGTASLRSIRICEGWKRRLGKRLSVVEVEDVTHFDMMRDPNVLDSIIGQLQDDMMMRCSGSQSDCSDAAERFSVLWWRLRWRLLHWRHRWGWVFAYPFRQLPSRLANLMEGAYGWIQSALHRRRKGGGRDEGEGTCGADDFTEERGDERPGLLEPDWGPSDVPPPSTPLLAR